MRQVEKWVLTTLGMSQVDVRRSLALSREATSFLLVGRVDVSRAYRHGISLRSLLERRISNLNVVQVSCVRMAMRSARERVSGV